jgi:hypothetical protein
MGPMLAATWSRTPNPPVGPGKAGYYAAALMNGANGDNRARLARCLIWCDVQTGQYVKSRLEWYRDAALAFPEDERCVFFVGALCYTKIYKDPDLTRHVYLQLIRPEWEKSRYWAQFEVNRVAVVSELAKLLATDTATITPERVAVIESVLHEALEREDRSIDRKLLANYLGVAYRSQQRTDENAEIVYRFLFNSDPEDTDNTLCLAQIYKERNQLDAPACAVYARMTVYAEEQGREDELDFWTQRLAQAYLNLNRLDEVRPCDDLAAGR